MSNHIGLSLMAYVDFVEISKIDKRIKVNY
mgnify:CR=1 FL=1